jgi:SAM-dependent methyltransferase
VTQAFDPYRDSYRDEVQSSIAFAGQDLGFFDETKVRELIDLVRAELGDPGDVRALDVGCGIGTIDALLRPLLGAVDGIDLSPAMVERAAEANPEGAYRAYEGERLPFDDGAYDLAFTFSVLHHVPPPDRPGFVAELARVVRPGGLVAVIEHNPLNPLTRLAVHRCAFDEDAVLLRRGEAERLLEGAGLRPAQGRYILFFPWRGAALRTAERVLRRIPAGAQYVAAGRRDSVL